MFEINTFLFLSLVALGAVVQTVTGFAMGLIIIAGVTALGIAEISYSAAVVSFISLANTAVALRHNHRYIDVQFVKWISIGLAPMLVAGVVLLGFLSERYYGLLQNLLGIVIIGAGVMLMMTPSPYPAKSGVGSTLACGALGGIIAGLYSAGGAPIAYFTYRQPVQLNVIRSSLLAIFAVSTLWRIIVVSVAGQVSAKVLLTAAVSIPVVVVFTMGAGRILHRVPDRLVRRMVFVLLIGVGSSLIFR